jgi:2,3-bisphosphoglycerate-independent phosphoglycerate mutase
MIDYETGKPHTEHTTNPVPFIYIGPGAKPIELPLGTLSDIAPTLLRIMKLPIPSSMALSRNLLDGIIE